VLFSEAEILPNKPSLATKTMQHQLQIFSCAALQFVFRQYFYSILEKHYNRFFSLPKPFSHRKTLIMEIPNPLTHCVILETSASSFTFNLLHTRHTTPPNKHFFSSDMRLNIYLLSLTYKLGTCKFLITY